MITLAEATVTFSSPGKAYHYDAVTNFGLSFSLACASRRFTFKSPCCGRFVLQPQASTYWARCSQCERKLPPTLSPTLEYYEDDWTLLLPWVEGRVLPLESVLVASALFDRCEALMAAHSPLDRLAGWQTSASEHSGLLGPELVGGS